MKKVYYIASLSLLLGFSACNNDFMDLYPEDKINDETYWKTESDLKNFANQFYTTLDNTGIYNSDNASDNQAPQSVAIKFCFHYQVVMFYRYLLGSHSEKDELFRSRLLTICF